MPRGRSRAEQALSAGLGAAIEAHFDAGFSNGWPELLADCQIAASRHGRLALWQHAYRRGSALLAAGSRGDPDTASGAALEAALAGAGFELRPDAWLAAMAPDDRSSAAAWRRAADALADNEHVRDAARNRVLRHRIVVGALLPDALGMLVGDGLPGCGAAVAFASRLVDVRDSGVRALWVCHDEVIVAGG